MSDRPYRHASFFSGIGAFDLGFERAGFDVVSHAEVKPFSNAVLETHWPGVPNLGDINAICPDGEGDHECEIPKADVWSGGFPCSDFSIMGKRKGLFGGNRSSLGVVFLDLVRRHRPAFVVLENVPGLLTSNEGADLAVLLDTLAGLGYGWAYRLLDARDFGLPQARRRVFVVAAASPDDAGAVLDDATDRIVDAPPSDGPGGAALEGDRGRAALRDPFVLGPTYSTNGRETVRTDGTAFPLTPNNFQYVPEPVVAQLTTRRGPLNARDDGSAYTLLPTERQWVVDDEPIVLRREGTRHLDAKRDGTTYTVLPAYGGWNGEQFIVGPGADEWDDLPLPGRGGVVLEPTVLGPRGGGLAAARVGGRRSGATAEVVRPADDGGPAGRPSPASGSGRVRAAARLPGRLDTSDYDRTDPMGPEYLDTARWHVLGRSCPVPIVEWIGAGVRAVIEGRGYVKENRDGEPKTEDARAASRSLG